jgi:two-component system OmpR family response regulator
MMGNLLIVDDEEDVLGVLAEYLTTIGYRVIPAATGREALEKLRTAAPFDVAVVDWTLPDIGGKEVIQAIRERQPDCCIVVTTGHGAEVVNEAYAGVVAGSIVRKPFTMRTLSTRVAMLLEKARNDR